MSEQKTAKVTDVPTIREWKSPEGRSIYYHTVVLDNGDKGSVGKKTSGAIKEGDTLNYTIDGDKIKEVFQNNGFGGFKGGQRGSSASFALSYAKDLVSAGHVKLDTIKDMTEATIAVANRFHSWLKEHE